VLCGIVARGGRTPGGRRRIDLMIAAVAIGDSAALATRNTSDFTGLDTLIHIITL
jgi:predicted nucleic acid-binding protein